MDRPDEPNSATGLIWLGKLTSKHVDFQYVADKPLIRDILRLILEIV